MGEIHDIFLETAHKTLFLVFDICGQYTTNLNHTSRLGQYATLRRTSSILGGVPHHVLVLPVNDNAGISSDHHVQQSKIGNNGGNLLHNHHLDLGDISKQIQRKCHGVVDLKSPESKCLRTCHEYGKN